METIRGVLKIILLVLLCCASSVDLKDGIESSGDGEVTEALVTDFFDTCASGGGPDTTSDSGVNVGILSDIADQELNETYIPIVPSNGDLNSVNGTAGIDISDTTTKSPETTVSSTTPETTSTSTAIGETTTLTDEPMTTTITAPMETPSSEPTTTEAPSTATTTVVTRPKTTKRARTPPPSPKTSRKPVSSTTSTTSDYELPPCSFNEEDFECSIEIACFGDGEVDCTETDEKEPQLIPTATHTTEEEYDDEYEDTALYSTEQSQLSGKVSPWQKLVAWQRRRYSSKTTTTEVTTERESTSSTTGTGLETSVASTTSQESLTTDSTIHSLDTTATSVVSDPATSSEKPGTEPANPKMSPLLVELPIHTDDSSTENASSERQPSVSGSHNSEVTSELPSTASLEVSTGGENDSSGSVESVEITESKSRKRRSKRQSKQPVPDSSVLSSSETLKLSSLSVTKETKDSRHCRIKGNLRCSPFPTLGFCKGNGRCQAAVEKNDKSTVGKGVENWAIAVIVICGTAAIVTIVLLMYLVITSWKKLKVQPQNGVTTLTYVNNAAP